MGIDPFVVRCINRPDAGGTSRKAENQFIINVVFINNDVAGEWQPVGLFNKIKKIVGSDINIRRMTVQKDVYPEFFFRYAATGHFTTPYISADTTTQRI